MAHKPFHVYKRPTTKAGKSIYYVQFYDDAGKRMTARSTGQTSKAAAETWAYAQLKAGVIPTEKNITFRRFAENFWTWDNCSYVKSRRKRKANLSRGYVDDMRTLLELHILPFFHDKKLQKIKSRTIETWLMELCEKRGRTGDLLSPTTINRCLTCLKIMLKEAVRLEYLIKSPAEGIRQFRENPKKKSILSMDEVMKLFEEGAFEKIWEGDLRYYTANLLAATTGVRIGEVQAFQGQNVHRGYVSILHSWDSKYGLGPPKWGAVRDIVIPLKTQRSLDELIKESQYQGPDDFVFYGKDGKTPLRNDQISNALYDAFERIGITREQRSKRNVTFHSWRHFFNSLMRGRVPDAKIRASTGHKTLQMQDYYTHFQLEDFADVKAVQEQYFK